jgi:branched-chain amino acid transport system substrate-binding protein
LILTLAPACGNGDEEATPTPGPGVTPTPGVPPTPTGEVKTLKIGFIGPLSGPGAPWGVPYVTGAEWAADRINEAGGFKVGNDTYMIKIVSCDDKGISSGDVECATKLVYEEGLKYIVGPIGQTGVAPIRDTLNDNKVFNSDVGAYLDLVPEYPYRILSFPLGWDNNWIRTFVTMVLERHPEIKTIAYINDERSWGDWHVSELQVAEEFGLEVVAAEAFQFGTTDFYPILTKIVAKNPDALNMESSQPGNMALIIKQARELGYKGIIFAPNGVLPEFLIPITGVEAAEGFLNNQADYTDPVWPEESRALYQDYVTRYPDLSMYTTTLAAFVSVNVYVKGIQQAGTTDTEAVAAAFDDPNFTFDFFGNEVKFGGRETFGVNRVFPFPNAFSVITNGELVQLDLAWVEVP